MQTVRIFRQKMTPFGLPETRAVTFTHRAFVSLRRNLRVLKGF
jgi:hypothetical protein